jgi:DNA-binding GntR family transcriptional regulator
MSRQVATPDIRAFSSIAPAIGEIRVIVCNNTEHVEEYGGFLGDIGTNVYNQLRDEIVTGKVNAGESLREESLARRLGASRTPVREALQRLQAEGFIEIVPRRGARVLGWKVEEIEDIFSLRGVLEPHAARQATLRLSEDELVLAHKLADEMDLFASEQPEGFEDKIAGLNNQFHAIVVGGSGNTRLSEQLQSIIELARVRATFQRYSPTELSRSMSQHRELLAAFEARDPDWAEAVMKCHIYAARSIYR